MRIERHSKIIKEVIPYWQSEYRIRSRACLDKTFRGTEADSSSVMSGMDSCEFFFFHFNLGLNVYLLVSSITSLAQR